MSLCRDCIQLSLVYLINCCSCHFLLWKPNGPQFRAGFVSYMKIINPLLHVHSFGINSSASLLLKPPNALLLMDMWACRHADFPSIPPNLWPPLPLSPFSSLSLSFLVNPSLPTPPKPPIISNQHEPSTSQSNRPATLRAPQEPAVT